MGILDTLLTFLKDSALIRKRREKFEQKDRILNILIPEVETNLERLKGEAAALEDKEMPAPAPPLEGYLSERYQALTPDLGLLGYELNRKLHQFYESLKAIQILYNRKSELRSYKIVLSETIKQGEEILHLLEETRRRRWWQICRKTSFCIAQRLSSRQDKQR